MASGPPREEQQLGAAFAFLLTWGSIPSIYYGDEIGLRYLTGLPDREGSIWSPGFNRAGCRTPMQWDDAEPNAGFSTAAPDLLYLPQEPDPQRPTVAVQHQDDGSTLNRLRRLIQLRRLTPALRPGPPTLVLSSGYPLVYQRGDQHLVVINPAGSARAVEIPTLAGRPAQALEVSGARVTGTHVTAAGFGYGIFHLGSPEADPAQR